MFGQFSWPLGQLFVLEDAWVDAEVIAAELKIRWSGWGTVGEESYTWWVEQTYDAERGANNLAGRVEVLTRGAAFWEFPMPVDVWLYDGPQWNTDEGIIVHHEGDGFFSTNLGYNWKLWR